MDNSQNNYNMRGGVNNLPPNNYPYYGQMPPNNGDNLATIALVLSIGSVICCCINPILSIPALIIAIISLNKHNTPTKTKQIIAIVLSSLSLLVFIPTMAFSNSGKTDKKDDIKVESEKEDREEDKEEVKEDKKEEKEYTKVEIQTLIDELDTNALKAQKTYKDVNVEITGKISSFDSDGKYITVEALNAPEFNLDRILVRINTDHKDMLLNCSVDDKVTVKGKITDVGESLGYTMSADIITAETTNQSNSVKELQANNSGYVEVTIQELIELLKSNALLAENTYQDAKLEFKGKISVIDSDGSYITVEDLNAGDWNFDTIHCSITDDSQLDVILEKSKGAEVTIKGKVTDIGEVLGYVVDIDEIK